MNRRRWMRTRKRLATSVPLLLVGHPEQTPGTEMVERIRRELRAAEPRGVVLPAGTVVEYHGSALKRYRGLVGA